MGRAAARPFHLAGIPAADLTLWMDASRWSVAAGSQSSISLDVQIQRLGILLTMPPRGADGQSLESLRHNLEFGPLALNETDAGLFVDFEDFTLWWDLDGWPSAAIAAHDRSTLVIHHPQLDHLFGRAAIGIVHQLQCADGVVEAPAGGVPGERLRGGVDLIGKVRVREGRQLVEIGIEPVRLARQQHLTTFEAVAAGIEAIGLAGVAGGNSLDRKPHLAELGQQG